MPFKQCHCQALTQLSAVQLGSVSILSSWQPCKSLPAEDWPIHLTISLLMYKGISVVSHCSSASLWIIFSFCLIAPVFGSVLICVSASAPYSPNPLRSYYHLCSWSCVLSCWWWYILVWLTFLVLCLSCLLLDADPALLWLAFLTFCLPSNSSWHCSQLRLCLCSLARLLITHFLDCLAFLSGLATLLLLLHLKVLYLSWSTLTLNVSHPKVLA